MMELKNTILMMESKDFKERFKAEYFQLKIRLQKLEAFIEKMKSKTLDFTPKCPCDVFEEQVVTMRAYLQVLEKRAKIEGINLEGV
jgi:hypothetical protein